MNDSHAAGTLGSTRRTAPAPGAPRAGGTHTRPAGPGTRRTETELRRAGAGTPRPAPATSRAVPGARAVPPAHTPHRLVFAALLGALLAVGALAASIGTVGVPYLDTMRIIAARTLGLTVDLPSPAAEIVWGIRLPRVLVAGLVGAALSTSGAAMQGLFKNPLASPGLAGVSSGASLGAVVAMFLGWHFLHIWLVPAAAFAGALFAAAIVYLLATRGGRTDMATLLLAGIAVSAFFSAVIAILYHFVEDGLLRQIVYWLMGNLTGRRWDHVAAVVPFVTVGSVALWYFAGDLNALMAGEDEARSMGVPVERSKAGVLALVSLTTGAAISVSGMIGFVGLITPHIVRLLVGPDHRRLLPASALAGASFLILSDLIARTIFSPVELRTGIVTAIFGVPFFLYLLARRRNLVRWS